MAVMFGSAFGDRGRDGRIEIVRLDEVNRPEIQRQRIVVIVWIVCSCHLLGRIGKVQFVDRSQAVDDDLALLGSDVDGSEGDLTAEPGVGMAGGNGGPYDLAGARFVGDHKILHDGYDLGGGFCDGFPDSVSDFLAVGVANGWLGGGCRSTCGSCLGAGMGGHDKGQSEAENRRGQKHRFHDRMK